MTFPSGMSYKALRPHEKNALKEEFAQCELCGKPEGLVIDHCHTTDIVRGVLCGSCNLRIGWIESITYDWAKRAATYLGNQVRAKEILRIVQQRFERDNQKWISELAELEIRQRELVRQIEKSKQRSKEIEVHLKNESEL